MSNELENDLDYASIIDREIPNGTISIDEQGRETVFKDGEFVLVE